MLLPLILAINQSACFIHPPLPLPHIRRSHNGGHTFSFSRVCTRTVPDRTTQSTLDERHPPNLSAGNLRWTETSKLRLHSSMVQGTPCRGCNIADALCAHLSLRQPEQHNKKPAHSTDKYLTCIRTSTHYYHKGQHPTKSQQA